MCLASWCGTRLRFARSDGDAPTQSCGIWGITFYEAYETAYTNLIETEAAFTTIEDHTYMSSTGDNYDASRMLIPELIAELKVLGEPVVMVPNRDRLFVTGSEDPEGLATMVLLAEHALTQPRPMTGIAMMWNGEEWSP